jgi:L,D-peptidoglycan transpeptidase YkuD (ErfK/YbiS/YcfS/YnhG family)
MNIIIKKRFLLYKGYKFKCSIGKSGVKKNKIEGDNATPKGIFSLGKFYYRPDRIKKVSTNLSCKKIKKNMGWCNDPRNIKYNKEVNRKKIKNSEKLYRKDYKYNAFIVINYNSRPVIKNKGSAIFLHLTKNYKTTEGCIAIKQNDFFKLVKIINNKTKIII